ncbi:MAG: hypothetical protein MJ175_09725, partial [Clostridia bacterium]|nr:hypothetical protein [Clostridia bacterium]
MERSDSTLHVTFIAENRAGEPRPMWFYFRLTDLLAEHVTQICLHAANGVQWLGDPYSFGHNRFVYRAAEGEWHRADPCIIRHCEDHTLDISSVIPCIASEMEFAFCYPYTSDDFEETINGIGQTSTIGYTNHGRPIIRSISGEPAKEQPGIYVIARQHSGEVTGSYGMDGIVKRISSTCPKGSVWCVPFADTDGVYEGLYGKDQIAGDFNRSWSGFFVSRTETAALVSDIFRFRETTDATWVIDLHSPGHDETKSYFVTSFDENSDDIRLKKLIQLQLRLNSKLREAGYQEVGILFGRGNTSSRTGKSAAGFLL